jgi:hypothetical protein
MTFIALAAVVILVSLALLVRPLWTIWDLASEDQRNCRICYLVLLCTPAIELALGVIALGQAVGLAASPGLMAAARGTTLAELHEIAPQSVWLTCAVVIASGHACSLFYELTVLRFVALLMSTAWWMYLMITAAPLWETSLGLGHYGGLTMIALLGLWGFSLERGRAN